MGIICYNRGLKMKRDLLNSNLQETNHPGKALSNIRWAQGTSATQLPETTIYYACLGQNWLKIKATI